MVVVAFLAATAGGVGPATMTSTWSRTSSAARRGSRSNRPSANRYSTTTFWDSVQPSSRSPCRKPPTARAAEVGEPLPRNPMRGTLPTGWASAPAGSRARARMSTPIARPADMDTVALCRKRSVLGAARSAASIGGLDDDRGRASGSGGLPEQLFPKAPGDDARLVAAQAMRVDQELAARDTHHDRRLAAPERG